MEDRIVSTICGVTAYGGSRGRGEALLYERVYIGYLGTEMRRQGHRAVQGYQGMYVEAQTLSTKIEETYETLVAVRFSRP